MCTFLFGDSMKNNKYFDLAYEEALIAYNNGEVPVGCVIVKNGEILAFDNTPYLKKAEKIMLSKNIVVNVDMNLGSSKATAWGCDLTYDYVKINAEYTT